MKSLEFAYKPDNIEKNANILIFNLYLCMYIIFNLLNKMNNFILCIFNINFQSVKNSDFLYLLQIRI